MPGLTINAGDLVGEHGPGLAAFCDWLRSHDIEPTGDHLTAHLSALNDEGRKYVNQDGDAATREPFTVPTTEPMPRG